MRKYIKYVGNMMVIISIIFIVLKLRKYDIDYSIFLDIGKLFTIVICSFIYGILIVLYSVPWKNFLCLFCNTSINIKLAIEVALKANLMKYIPGNIFQYVGKNEIAVRSNLSHFEVASATIFDVIFNAISAMIVSLIFYGNNIFIVIRAFSNYLDSIFGVMLIIVCIVILGCFIFHKYKDKYIDSLNRLLSKNGLRILIYNILIYLVLFICISFMYVIVLVNILDMHINMQDCFEIMGAFTLSWLVGFLVPGAPGGIGIRESVIVMLLSDLSIGDSPVLLGILIYRIISTIGDIIGFLFSKGLKVKD